MGVEWDEEAQGQEILGVSLYRDDQERMIRKFREFELRAEEMFKLARTPDDRLACREARTLAVQLRVWMRDAVKPVGYVLGSITEREEESPAPREAGLDGR